MKNTGFFYLPQFCTGIAALSCLLDAHQACLLFHLHNSTRKEHVMEKLRSWRKNKEITYHLQLGEKWRSFLKIISFQLFILTE